jgi:serine phosphatase RsbU (regulator of sigma subunit)
VKKQSRVTLRGLLRLVARQTVLAVPFALFFTMIFGEGLKTFWSFYLVSLLFTYMIAFAILINRTFVLPRIVGATSAEGGSALVIEIGSYAVAAMLGSVAAAAIVETTVGKGVFTSPRGISLFVSFTLLFSALFLGLVYSMRFQKRLVERIRAEAEVNTREEHELKIAGEIQRGLQPGRPRVTRSFSAAGAAIACRTIGGDFFDYFDLPGGRLGFALGDVAGKGPPAALLAAMVQGIFTSHVDDGHGPAGTIERVNRVLNGRIVEGRFATVFYAVLSPDGRLVSCNAGNNYPYLVSCDGAVRRLEKGGLPIGPFEGATYEEEETPLRPGDTLILYSDGVSDAADANDEPFGEDRLLASLGPACAMEPEKLIEHVLGEVSAFAAARPQFDDITLLVVRYAGE